MSEPEYDDVRAACSLPAVAVADGHLHRRTFLKGALAGAGGILLAPLLGQLEALAAPPIGPTDGVLVCIQLGGGLDGLHVLAPYADPEYQRLRGPIALGAGSVLPLNANVGLHPALTRVKTMYDQGKAAIVQGVGFSGQDGSHFTSMATWLRGWNGSASGARGTGWLGRFLDALPNAATEPLRGLVFGTSVPLNLLGANASVSALPLDASGFFGVERSRPSDERLYATLGALNPSGLGSLADAYTGSMRDAIALPRSMQSAYDNLDTGWDLERQTQIAARLINANLGTRIISCDYNAFDWHDNLLTGMQNTLRRVDAAIARLFDTVAPAYRNRVTVLVFSEFGRRPAANGTDSTGGTDHGTANVMLLLGERVRGGLYGAQPSLAGFGQDSNPVASTDFRQVYGEIAQTWLNADPAQIAGLNPSPMGLFRGGPTL